MSLYGIANAVIGLAFVYAVLNPIWDFVLSVLAAIAMAGQ